MRNKLPAPQVAADEVAIPCHKCGTTGFYCMGTRNGQPYSFTGFDCHPCGARGWIVRSKAGEERRQKRIANEEARFKAEEAARVEKAAKVDAIWIPLVPRVEALRAAAGLAGTNRRAHFEQALSKAWSQDNILSGAFLKSLEELEAKAAAEAAKRAESEYLGTLGERREFEGVILFTTSFDSAYGTRFLTVVDCGGNVVKYWNQLGEKGEEVKFKATVKAHEVYQGQKQTVVQRAKVIDRDWPTENP